MRLLRCGESHAWSVPDVTGRAGGDWSAPRPGALARLDGHAGHMPSVFVGVSATDAYGQVRCGLSNEIELMPLALKLMCATSWVVSREPSLPRKFTWNVNVDVPF